MVAVTGVGGKAFFVDRAVEWPAGRRFAAGLPAATGVGVTDLFRFAPGTTISPVTIVLPQVRQRNTFVNAHAKTGTGRKL
jgi:hypothetical protein